MKNFERYKTSDERINAFERYHNAENSHCDVCPSHNVRCLGSKTAKGYLCYQSWLDLEVEDEKPMPCPFCGAECFVNTHSEGHEVRCSARHCYVGKTFEKEYEAIAAHNLVCKAVAAYKESEAAK